MPAHSSQTKVTTVEGRVFQEVKSSSIPRCLTIRGLRSKSWKKQDRRRRES